MHWSSRIVTSPPAAEPVLVADALAHCRADASDTALMTAYAMAARNQVEAFTGTGLITQTVSFTARCLGDCMVIPAGPIQSLAFTYLDVNGAPQTLDPTLYAVVGQGSLRTVVELIPGKAWPALLPHPTALTCAVVIGYGSDGTTVPPAIRQAILLLVGDFYANREDTIAERGVLPATLPNGVSALLANYRIW